MPANVVGVTLVQCHLVAGIAHLRGYDLEDARVRNAILACMLGEDEVRDLVRTSSFPSSPMGIATSPVHDPVLDELVSREVTTDLLARTAGRRAVTMVGRRVPLLGGVVGGGSDALMTWQIGQYAARELRDRNRPLKPPSRGRGPRRTGTGGRGGRPSRCSWPPGRRGRRRARCRGR